MCVRVCVWMCVSLNLSSNTMYIHVSFSCWSLFLFNSLQFHVILCIYIHSRKKFIAFSIGNIHISVYLSIYIHCLFFQDQILVGTWIVSTASYTWLSRWEGSAPSTTTQSSTVPVIVYPCISAPSWFFKSFFFFFCFDSLFWNYIFIYLYILRALTVCRHIILMYVFLYPYISLFFFLSLCTCVQVSEWDIAIDCSRVAYQRWTEDWEGVTREGGRHLHILARPLHSLCWVSENWYLIYIFIYVLLLLRLPQCIYNATTATTATISTTPATTSTTTTTTATTTTTTTIPTTTANCFF